MVKVLYAHLVISLMIPGHHDVFQLRAMVKHILAVGALLGIGPEDAMPVFHCQRVTLELAQSLFLQPRLV